MRYDVIATDGIAQKRRVFSTFRKETAESFADQNLDKYGRGIYLLINPVGGDQIGTHGNFARIKEE